jgi:hypothetical protein
MKDLIERLEKATGPDADLDAAIFEAVNGVSAYRNTHGFSGGTVRKRMQGLPAYTDSLDAALSLVPEMYEGSLDIRNPAVGQFGAKLWTFKGGGDVWGKGINQAIALCIAALKARALLSDDGKAEVK